MLGYRFGIRLTDWSSFWYSHLIYSMHYDIVGPDGRYIRTAWSDNDCQNTNYSAQQRVGL